MNNKLIYKILNVAIYCVGFPVLAIVTLVMSIKWNSYGMYGVGAFAPFLFVLVAWALTALIVFAVHAISKKTGKYSKGKLRYAAAIVPLVLIFGIFIIFEAALPALLDDATSGTIKYEDVIEDADGMHNKLVERVETFKEKNNLDDSVKYNDKKFQDIMNAIFPSMDKAYKSFDPLAISVALAFPDLTKALLNGDVPLTLVATLIVETVKDDPIKYNHFLSLDEILELNEDKISDALGLLIANVDSITDPDTLNQVVDAVLVSKTFDGITWNIFNILGTNILTNEDPNLNITKVVEGEEPVIVGSALGYQDMAWLDGLDQMFFIPLFSAKTLLFAFALAIAILGMLQSLLQVVYYKKFDEELSLLNDIKNIKAKKANA